MYDTMLQWLEDLDGVEQDPRYHPEEDALFHSLQVYQHALRHGPRPELLAAALFHDVGKAHSGPDHDTVGAAMTVGLPVDTRWLIGHHLDLLRNPRKTRRVGAGSRWIADLELLRRWDLAGRDPHATVCSPEEAVSVVLEALEVRDGQGGCRLPLY